MLNRHGKPPKVILTSGDHIGINKRQIRTLKTVHLATNQWDPVEPCNLRAPGATREVPPPSTSTRAPPHLSSRTHSPERKFHVRIHSTLLR